MSRIEQLIGEIEAYLDDCKYQPLSNTRILVNKDEIDELLMELRLHIPEEIKRCQKILSNQDAIKSQAQTEANAMLEAAKAHTSELVNEHEIMQQAYAQADGIVDQAKNQVDMMLANANAQAQNIVDTAVNDANNIRHGSIQYTDDMLKSLQTIINHSMEGAHGRFDAFMNSMQSSYDIVTSNRNELSSGVVEENEGIKLEG